MLGRFSSGVFLRKFLVIRRVKMVHPDVQKAIQLSHKSCSFAGMQIMSKEKTKSIWRNADAVCFDVDSTVCPTEAIDELAAYCGKKEEVERV